MPGPIRSLCFTGHRPQKLCSPYNEQSPQMQQLLAWLRQEIQQAAARGCTTFYTGMAMGVDLLAAEEVLRQRETNPALHLYAIVPFYSQSASFPPEWKRRYHRVLLAADLVHYLQAEYSNTCMANRNRYLVEHSDLVVAVYCESPISGTAQTIRMAKAAKKELHLLRRTAHGWETLQDVAPDAL